MIPKGKKSIFGTRLVVKNFEGHYASKGVLFRWFIW